MEDRQHRHRVNGPVLHVASFCLSSGILLVLNKAAMVQYPFANVVLLLQLLTSAGLAWASPLLGEPGVEALDSQKMLISTPLVVAFFCVLWSCLNVLRSVTADTLITLKVATTVAATLAEWLFFGAHSPSASTVVSLMLTMLLAAAAFSMQLAAVPVTSLVWLLIWFCSTVVYQLLASNYVRIVHISVSSRVFYVNLLSVAPCLVNVAIFDLSSPAAWSLASGSAAAMVSLSCLLGFVLSWSGWVLLEVAAEHPGPAGSSHLGSGGAGVALLDSGLAVDNPVLGVLSKLLSLGINCTIWSSHGPVWSQVFLALGVLTSAFSHQQPGQQQQQQQHQHQQQQQLLGHKQHKHQPRNSSLGSAWRNSVNAVCAVVAVAATVAALLWTAASMAQVAYHHSLAFEHSGWDHELELLRNQTHGLEQRVEHSLVQELQMLKNATLGLEHQVESGLQHLMQHPSQASAGNDGRPAGAAPAAGATVAGSPKTAEAGASAGAAAAGVDAAGAGAAAGPESSGVLVDAGFMAKLKAAVATPINVAVMTGVFWTFEGKTDNCSIEGLPIKCKFHTSPSNAVMDTADLLYYHIPGFAGKPRPKAFPHQLRLGMSLESSAYYVNLDNPQFMCQFDAEMSYRTCSQVVNWYSLESFADLFNMPVKPWEEKEHALVYINSNCGAQSGRTTIMRNMIKLDAPRVPVHSFGRCDNNKPWPPGNPSKRQVFNRYKFCVTMENSIRQDYVTEKVWDGLAAGCVPVYLGAPSAPQFLPDPASVIMYDPEGRGNASTPEELDALLDKIGRDKERYEAMLAWKKNDPLKQPSPLFRYLWSVQHMSGECFLCQFLARHRANPKPRYTTCLFNQTWMEGARQKYVEAPANCNSDSDTDPGN